MSFIKRNKMGQLKTNQEVEIRAQIVEAYEHVGGERDEATGKWIVEGKNWLDGLEGSLKLNAAILFENQAQALMTENTGAENAGAFEVVAFPMIRRIFSRLLANEIVSVQALTQPSGTIFYFYPQISDRVFGTDGSSRTTGDHTTLASRSQPECLGANCPDTTFSSCRSLYDRFYNDAQWDHSRGKYTIITATGSTVVIGDTGCAVPTTATPLSFDGSYREVKFGVTGFESISPSRGVNTARLKGVNGLEVDTDEFLSSFSVINVGSDILDKDGAVIIKQGGVVNWRPVAQRYGESLVNAPDLCDENGVFTVALDLTHPVCGDCKSTDDYIGAVTGTTFTPDRFAFAWRRYDDFEFESQMGEVTFELKKITVSVRDRQLRASWSPQFAQDVAAYHDIDAEAELTQLLSEQIAMEIDREILRELKNGAAWRKRWNYYGWKGTNTQKYTQKEWNQTLITIINQISAQIHKSTLRGGANFIVVSSEVSAALDDLETFMTSGNNEDDRYNLGMRKAGTIAGRYDVYVDPYSNARDILVGYKGGGQLDVGYVYLPYVAAQLTPTLTDYTNFANIKGIMTRYAAKMVNNRMYGRILVDNIPTFDVNELR